ncbi:MAG: hypothetical protein O3C43_11270, partial [Verrucomicrobia bacterium]|nr:hypothetical protein [Verrucomicrobiota bacterium]
MKHILSRLTGISIFLTAPVLLCTQSNGQNTAVRNDVPRVGQQDEKEKGEKEKGQWSIVNFLRRLAYGHDPSA